MGASAWYETGPYDADLGAALRAAQEIALRSGVHGVNADSIDELWQDEDWVEFVGTGGTGTVLDLCQLIGADQADSFATLLPMGAGEFRELLGIWRRPIYADFVEGYATGKLPNPQSRGSARCAVLYQDEKPNQVVYWGLTAD